MEKRNWREAKLPQWVKDSIVDETDALELITALAWPTEAKPTPLFWGVGYGQVAGKPESGKFWAPQGGSFEPVELEISMESGSARIVNRSANSQIYSQRFFRTKHEAELANLWSKCEEFAKDLRKIRRRLKDNG